MTQDGNITEILDRWSAGETEAVDDVLPFVYSELKQLANGKMRRERPSHTLQPTALVHEAFLRLADRLPPRWDNRSHFYALAARVMRQVLVDHARRVQAEKRGGGAVHVTLEDVAGAGPGGPGGDVLALDAALESLRALDPRKARIIELRFFGGLSIDETATLLELSAPTIVNETRKARAWLYNELS